MEENKVEDKPTFLPNPDALRQPIVEKCSGCNKIFEGYAAPESEILTDVCIAYIDPAALQRRGCCLQSNKFEDKKDEKKKINPLKASKRARR
jgi:hypothetical protein